jgi:hypothetical protein
MIEDLHLETPIPGTNTMSSQRYSTACVNLILLFVLASSGSHPLSAAAFYWGYLVGVLPIALILQRAPVSKALGTLLFVGLKIYDLYQD